MRSASCPDPLRSQAHALTPNAAHDRLYSARWMVGGMRGVRCNVGVESSEDVVHQHERFVREESARQRQPLPLHRTRPSEQGRRACELYAHASVRACACVCVRACVRAYAWVRACVRACECARNHAGWTVSAAHGLPQAVVRARTRARARNHPHTRHTQHEALARTCARPARPKARCLPRPPESRRRPAERMRVRVRLCAHAYRRACMRACAC